MSDRCSRTGRLTRLLALGDGLGVADRAHVARCPDCARAVAAYQRFERELHQAAVARVEEPMARGALDPPPALGRRTPWLPLAGGLSAVAAGLAVVLLAGSLIGAWTRPPAASGPPHASASAIAYPPLPGISASALRTALEGIGLSCATADVSLKEAYELTAPGVRCSDPTRAEKRVVSFLTADGDRASHLVASIAAPKGVSLSPADGRSFLDQVAGLTLSPGTADGAELQAWIDAVTSGENGSCSCGPISAGSFAYRLQAQLGASFTLVVEAGSGP